VIIDLPQAVDAAGNNHARACCCATWPTCATSSASLRPSCCRTQYGPEIWAQYERGTLSPDTPLTGRWEPRRGGVDLRALMREIDDARDEETARPLPP
jgi:RIO kinase 1